MAENTIDNLSIQVTASAENAARVFDRLASSAGRLRGAAQGAAGGMQDMAQGARDAATAGEQAGTQSGRARPNIRGVGKDAKDAGENAKKGSSGLATFWQSLKRIAFYRFIRTVLKEIGAGFKEGITNLYQWSSAVNGTFASSMNQIATSTNYLKNSLGAMAAPLINALAPALDFLIDKVVDLLNIFNQFFAAIGGQSTYTVAKKVASTWSTAGSSAAGSAHKAAEEIKRTLLGFDEINKLTKPSSGGGGGGGGGGTSGSSGGYEFEEKPLEGFFKGLSELTEGWPDWLKWLFGIGSVAIGAWGISQLPKLIGHIWDAIKNLFSTKIPDWFRWLFGPKGDGDGGLDIPDEINLPDADIPVNLTQGDWSVLDQIEDKSVDVITAVKKAPTWDNDAWSAANMGGKNVAVFIDVAVRKALTWNDDAWKAANMGGSTVVRFVDVAVKKAPTWNNDAFKAANWGGSNVARFIDVAVRKAKTWNNDAFKAANMGGSTVARFIDVAVRKAKTWNNDAWSAANMGGKNVSRFVDVAVRKAKTWNDNAWSAANMGGKTVARFVNVAVTKAKTWNDDAYNAAKMGARTVSRFVNVATQKAKTWNNDAFKAANMGGATVSRFVNVSVIKDKWNEDAWKAATKLSSYKVTVTITFKKKGYDDAVKYTLNAAAKGGSYGGAVGGGGSVDGGGAGRSRHAKGGIFSNGVWSNIPQYAGGTANAHGSLFLAGEAGPEIVGHVGGRTEVLNKSQLASAMFSAVQAAMAPAAASFASAAQSMGVANVSFDFETLAEMIRQGVEQAMSRSNDYDRQKVELLRSINEKESTVEVSTSSINRAQQRMNRRAGTTIVAVGN